MRPASHIRLPLPWLIGLFALHILPFATRPALIGGDEPHYALMAHSIARDGDFELRDDYAEVAAGSAAAGRKQAGRALDPHLRGAGQKEIFAHPLGLPLIAAPLVALLGLVAPGAPPDLLLGVLGLGVTFLGLVAGWRLLATYLGSPRDAAFVAFGGYFSSPLWFYSRTFFTEPYTWAWAVLAVAAAVGGRTALASCFLALTLAMKETALLLVAPILLAVLWLRGARAAAVLAVGPAIFGLLFGVKNLLLTGSPFTTFYPFLLGAPLEGALGLLAAPDRGLLWFAPLLSAGLAGSLVAAKGRADRRLAASAALVFAGYFALTAAWVDWRGGSSYGPRLLVPALPALALLLAHLWTAAGTPLRRALGGLFVLGFTVHWCAALDPVPAFWSGSAPALLGEGLAATASGLGVGGGLLWLLLARFPDRTPGEPQPEAHAASASASVNTPS